ncbi:MAG: hypothetical protein ABEK12_00990 [Candidatus Nanohaloarchaea archaeon]
MQRDTVQHLLNALLIAITIVYIGPGLLLLQHVRFRVLGWPFFVLWSVVIAPASVLAIFVAKMYLRGELTVPFTGGDSDGV